MLRELLTHGISNYSYGDISSPFVEVQDHGLYKLLLQVKLN